AKEQGLWHDPSTEPAYSEHLELDLSTVVPSIAGPKRPQDRVALADAKAAFRAALRDYVAGDEHVPHTEIDEAVEATFPASDPAAVRVDNGAEPPLQLPSAAAGATGRPSSPARVTLDDGTECEIDHGA